MFSLHTTRQFLATVAEQSDVNLMTTSNLSVVFGPNLLKPRVMTIERMLTDVGAVNCVVGYLITHASELFDDAAYASLASEFDAEVEQDTI